MSAVSADRSSLASCREQLLSRLAAVRAALRRRFLAEGVATLLGCLLGCIALTLLLDWQLELSRVARIACWLVILSLSGWVVAKHLWRPLWMRLDPLDVADAIDRRQSNSPPITPRVASVLQLPEQVRQREGVSSSLTERACEASFQSLEQVDLRRHLSGRHLAWCLSGIFLAILAPAAFAVLLPGPSRLWAERWLLGSDRAWPRDTRIEVAGVHNGRLIVPRGEPFSLQVLVTDSERETDTVWLRMKPQGGKAETLTLTRFAPGDFRADLPPQQLPLDVEVWGGDTRAEPFRIDPRDRPRIVGLTLTAQHPRDAKPAEHRFSAGEGNIRLLPQSDVQLSFDTNVPVHEVQMETAGPGSEHVPKQFSPRSATKFASHWTFAGAVQLRVTLKAAESDLTSHPQPIAIGELTDRPPRVGLRYRAVRQRVTPAATIPATISARDDFGVRSVSLLVEVPDMKAKAPAGEATDPTTEVTDAEPSSEASAVNGEPVSTPPDEGESTTQADTSREASAPAGEKPENQNDPSADAPPPTEAVPAAATSFSSPPSMIFLYGPTSPAIEPGVELEHLLDLAPRNLQPGALVTLQAAADDDHYQVPQGATSQKVVFRIVREDELFREILLRQQQLRARLRKARDQAEELRDRLPAAILPDDAGELLRQQQFIGREVSQVSDALHVSVEELKFNKLGGEETWQLITDTVLKPLRKVDEQDLTRQRQALESLLSREPEELADIQSRQVQIVADLDRILAAMAQWDSFIDVVNQLDAVIKLETAIRQQTETLRKTQVESVFDDLK